MPGLLRGIARTAAVAGTATAVGNRVSRRQARKWGEQSVYSGAPGAPGEPAPPAPPPAPAADPVARLQELAQLRADGVITDAEFAAAKAKVLG